MDHVIFKIKDGHTIRGIAKVTHLMDIWRATGVLKGDIAPVVDYIDGKMSLAYLMRRDDYMAHMATSGLVDESGKVHVIPEDVRQPTHIADHETLAFRGSVSPLAEIEPDDVGCYPEWIVNLQTKKAFTNS